MGPETNLGGGKGGLRAGTVQVRMRICARARVRACACARARVRFWACSRTANSGAVPPGLLPGMFLKAGRESTRTLCLGSRTLRFLQFFDVQNYLVGCVASETLRFHLALRDLGE